MDKELRQSILDRLSAHSTPQRPIYLVGGAVRDLLMDRPVHDLDFVLPGPTRRLAQDIACELNAALYVLDEERDTTRVVVDTGQNLQRQRVLLDFATLRAQDLEGDLRARDFSINAMAFDVAQPDRLIDPTGGLVDLRAKCIRASGPLSLREDPVRVLRAIRLALNFQFRIGTETWRSMQAAAAGLPSVSAERQRDELFRILEGKQVALAVRLLDQAGALVHLLPELAELKGVTQSAPHTLDVWEHTLLAVQYLEQLYAPLVGEYQPEKVGDLTVGSAVLWLGRFRKNLEDHYRQVLVQDRSLRALLFLAALYHDVSKPETRVETLDGRVRFLEHQLHGARKLARRARELALSAAEVQRLETIVEHHMRVHFLAEASASAGDANDGLNHLSRRSIYRFFKDTGPAGVDICLLSLADLRGTYGVSLPQDLWEGELRTTRALMEAYWEKREEVVSPPRLVTGNDLMRVFNLKPGPALGRLINAIREGQAVGEIHNQEEAFTFARRWLEEAGDSAGHQNKEKKERGDETG